ncbi:MAG: Fe-S cluster assembly protein SufD [Planctomycetes bacterium]|nr:Fe-S cluster assembly protein SufD [Planctomycetota bacterium]
MTDTLVEAAHIASATHRADATDPDWVRKFRAAALERWNAEPLPDRVEHLWRYTGPERILPGAREFTSPDGRFGDLPSDFADAMFEKAAAYAVCRDGVLLRCAVDSMVADLGVVVEDLHSAAMTKRKLLEPHLGALRGACDGIGAKFDHLTAAAFTGGAFVHIPRGVTLERPIRISSRIGGSGVLAARSVFIVEPGAQATIVVDLASAEGSEDAATMFHETTEVFVGASARLRIVFVQTLGPKVIHAPAVRARVAHDGLLESVSVALGGGTVKALLASELAETGAKANVLGIVFGDGRRHFDHHTFQDHLAPSTTSNLDYRTVVGGRARSAYTGRLRIRPGALKSEARQRNHNLVLSDDARADTIPELEILADDVSCSHAAAVAPIDEEQVFFCESRGFSPDEARSAIVLGFLEPTVAQIPGDLLLARVRAALEKRLAAVVGAQGSAR